MATEWIMKKLFGVSATSDFKAPVFIKEAMKKKYGQDIFVIGVSSRELSAFLNGMSYHTIETTRPVEVGRSVVDIECKSHANTSSANERLPDWYKDPELREKTLEDTDWYDKFEITSNKGSEQTTSKTYNLKFESSTTKSIGGSLGIKVGAAGFFNMAAAPTAEGTAGISGSYSKTNKETEERGKTEGESLTYGYKVVDTLKVPPKTKVEAMITTWAVTYESTTTTEVTVDMTHVLLVRFRTMFSRRLGGLFPSTGVLTAYDLFGEEEGFKCEDYLVTFRQKGKISYLGEEVEVVKRKEQIEP